MAYLSFRQFRADPSRPRPSLGQAKTRSRLSCPCEFETYFGVQLLRLLSGMSKADLALVIWGRAIRLSCKLWLGFWECTTSFQEPLRQPPELADRQVRQQRLRPGRRILSQPQQVLPRQELQLAHRLAVPALRPHQWELLLLLRWPLLHPTAPALMRLHRVVQPAVLRARDSERIWLRASTEDN